MKIVKSSTVILFMKIVNSSTVMLLMKIVKSSTVILLKVFFWGRTSPPPLWIRRYIVLGVKTKNTHLKISNNGKNVKKVPVMWL